MTEPASAPPARTRADWSLLALVVTVVLWASAFVGIRSAGEDFSPGPLALGRLLVGTVVLTAIVLTRPAALPRGRTLAYVVGYGVLWFGAYNVALNAGERHVDAGTASMLVQLGPIIIAILAGLFLGEGFPRTLVVGVAVAFCGVVLITVGSDSGGSDNDVLGIVLCIVAAILYAAGVMLQRPALHGTSALQATWLGCAIGTIACLPFLGRLVHEVGDADTGAIAGVVYLGVFPTAVAFTTWAYALHRIGAGLASSTTYLAPAVAILLSWLILDETPTVVSVVGGVVCLAGVAIARMRRAPR